MQRRGQLQPPRCEKPRRDVKYCQHRHARGWHTCNCCQVVSSFSSFVGLQPTPSDTFPPADIYKADAVLLRRSHLAHRRESAARSLIRVGFGRPGRRVWFSLAPPQRNGQSPYLGRTAPLRPLGPLSTGSPTAARRAENRLSHPTPNSTPTNLPAGWSCWSRPTRALAASCSCALRARFSRGRVWASRVSHFQIPESASTGFGVFACRLVFKAPECLIAAGGARGWSCPLRTRAPREKSCLAAAYLVVLVAASLERVLEAR